MKYNRTTSEVPEHVTKKFVNFVRKLKAKKERNNIDNLKLKDVLYYANNRT